MTETELQHLTESISTHFFEKPFKHQARFNSRLRTTGGRYLLKSHDIELNYKHYMEFGRTELIGIIKHELCHYHLHLEGKGYGHADVDFKQLLKAVDAPRHCQTIPRETTILSYCCNDCGQLYQRQRKINTRKYVCGSCNGKLKFISKKGLR